MFLLLGSLKAGRAITRKSLRSTCLSRYASDVGSGGQSSQTWRDRMALFCSPPTWNGSLHIPFKAGCYAPSSYTNVLCYMSGGYVSVPHTTEGVLAASCSPYSFSFKKEPLWRRRNEGMRAWSCHSECPILEESLKLPHKPCKAVTSRFSFEEEALMILHLFLWPLLRTVPIQRL